MANHITTIIPEKNKSTLLGDNPVIRRNCHRLHTLKVWINYSNSDPWLNPFDCRAGKHTIDCGLLQQCYLQNLNFRYHARAENNQNRMAHDDLGDLWATYSVPASILPIYKRLELLVYFPHLTHIRRSNRSTLSGWTLAPKHEVQGYTVWIASLAMVHYHRTSTNPVCIHQSVHNVSCLH